MGQMSPTISISPKNLAKPHCLTGLLTLGLEQVSSRSLRVTHSFVSNSTQQLLTAELKDTQTWLACHKRHHHWRYQDWPSPLDKQCISPSNAKTIPQARTVSHPQVLVESLHCLSSASYAVPVSREEASDTELSAWHKY